MKVIPFILLSIWFILSTSAGSAQLERVIAHRGASFDAPENTTSAIALAIKHGAKMIEFDVRQTTDGKLFLFHDDELDRLCSELGAFKDLHSQKAARLDVGSWFAKANFASETPPLMSAAIEQCIKGGAVSLIEHKTGSSEVYAKVIQELDAIDKVIVQSFDWRFIREIKERLPSLRTGVLGTKTLSAHKLSLLTLRPNWVGWSDQDITKSDIDWLKENGFSIAVWTINDPIKARRRLDMGVDKIITDRPKFIENRIGK